MTGARAKVHSIEAIESFRTSLILYLEKAGRVLDDIRDEVVQTRLWLQHDRRRHWQNELHRRTRELERRQQELFSARLSRLRDSTLIEQRAVDDARRAVEQAETKLHQVKQWNLNYESRVGPLEKEVKELRQVLADDMRLAVAYLAQAVQTLDAYAEVAPPQPEPTAPSAAPQDSPSSATHESDGSDQRHAPGRDRLSSSTERGSQSRL